MKPSTNWMTRLVPIDEAAQELPRIDAGLCAALVKASLDA